MFYIKQYNNIEKKDLSKTLPQYRRICAINVLSVRLQFVSPFWLKPVHKIVLVKGIQCKIPWNLKSLKKRKNGGWS